MPKKPNQTNYVDNKEFGRALSEYIQELEKAKELRNKALEEKWDEVPELPVVPDYIAICFQNIAEGLSMKNNFIGYTFREEMVLDAVENCLRAIKSYKPAGLEDGSDPNAFSYFTTVCNNAFLRRIKKENRQTQIKAKYIQQSGLADISQYASLDGDASMELSQIMAHLDSMRTKLEQNLPDEETFNIEVEEKKRSRKKTIRLADSNLEEYFNEI